MFRGRRAVVTLLMFVIFACRADGAEPVPAKLYHIRDGLGNVFDRLNEGEDLRIAYLGGSITAQRGWRVKTLDWFRQAYPDAQVSEINAAIGGTGSDLGVFRLEQDVLRHDPNLLFVEFAVNDGGTPPRDIHRAMEGIIRQTWQNNAGTDICFVYTFRVGYEQELDRGRCPRAAAAHERIAGHYGIPSINMALRIAQLGRQDKLTFKATEPEDGKTLFSHDGVHPVDAGHEIYRDVIVEALKEMAKSGKPVIHALQKPYVEDNLEDAKLVPIAPSWLSEGWRKLSSEKDLGKRFHKRLPVIRQATEPGEKISFRFKGTAVGAYDLMGPDGGIAICTVDGKVVTRSPRFDKYCTYHRLATIKIASGLKNRTHEVSIEVSPKQPDREVVLSRVRGAPGFDPKKYNGTVLRIGAIMLVGDVVE